MMVDGETDKQAASSTWSVSNMSQPYKLLGRQFAAKNNKKAWKTKPIVKWSSLGWPQQPQASQANMQHIAIL